MPLSGFARPAVPSPIGNPTWAPEPVEAQARSPVALVRLCELSDEAMRMQVKAFISRRFEQAYGARIRHFLPRLFGLGSVSGELLAACGLRTAAEGPLFLERYLDRPVEVCVGQVFGQAVQRSQLAEIGNLAGAHAGALRLLIPMLTARLHREGFHYVTFTGPARLGNGFARLGLPLEPLAPALIERLPPGERAAWGRYYEAAPQVMVGDVRSAFARLKRRTDVVQMIGSEADCLGVPA